MEQMVRKMKADDKCICDSGKTWKQCCGQLMDDPEVYSGHIQLSEEKPIRFFLGDLRNNTMHTDDEGRPIVFTSRGPALALNQRLGHKYQILGMGDSKWALFQADFPNLLLILDAAA
jgi:hypothetical protein